jgi:spore coat protein U-like protein
VSLTFERGATVKNFFVSVVVVGVVAFAPEAMASTDAVGSLSVGAQVTSACTVNTSSIDFGTFDTRTARSDSEVTGAVSVTCTTGAAYSVKLDAGLYESTADDVRTRRMKHGSADYLAYSLYTSSDRDTHWGTAVGTGTAVVTGTGSGSSQSLTVYGRIPISGNNVPVGTYSDTVGITITY